MTLEACYAEMNGDLASALLVLESEERVRRYLLRFAGDPTARLLFAALEDGRWADAFRAAHTLKGLCRALGLVPLCAACCALCDALRAGQVPQNAGVELAKGEYAAAMRAVGQMDSVHT